VAGGWRLAAHARADAALEARDAPAFARAHHLERAGRPGDGRARATLAAAADAVNGRAPAIAARWYLAALRLLPPARSDEERRALLVALAGALRSAGRLDESGRALERALALGPGRAEAVALTTQVADLERLLGRHEAARSRLQAARRTLAGDDAPESATLLYELASDRAYGADFPSIRAWATRAHAALRLDDAALLAGASALLGLADYRAGDFAGAESNLDEAADRLRRLDDDVVARRLDALFYTGWLALFLERFDDTVAHARRGLAVARRSGHGHLLDSFRVGATIALLARGHLRDAHELADDAVEAARLSGNPQALSWALQARCRAAVLLGDTRAGLRDGEDALALASGHDPSLLTRQAACRIAGAFLDAGQPDRCQQLMLVAAGGPELPYSEPGYRPLWYEALARAALAMASRPQRVGGTRAHLPSPGGPGRGHALLHRREQRTGIRRAGRHPGPRLALPAPGRPVADRGEPGPQHGRHRGPRLWTPGRRARAARRARVDARDVRRRPSAPRRGADRRRRRTRQSRRPRRERARRARRRSSRRAGPHPVTANDRQPRARGGVGGPAPARGRRRAGLPPRPAPPCSSTSIRPCAWASTRATRSSGPMARPEPWGGCSSPTTPRSRTPSVGQTRRSPRRRWRPARRSTSSAASSAAIPGCAARRRSPRTTRS
jgi:hypothetical protein